ncbi:hypothetical protein NL676_029214 [Syzygium grande]|nr:hypothetical protein NL676_029214 [Syzygium grande]
MDNVFHVTDASRANDARGVAGRSKCEMHETPARPRAEPRFAARKAAANAVRAAAHSARETTSFAMPFSTVAWRGTARRQPPVAKSDAGGELAGKRGGRDALFPLENPCGGAGGISGIGSSNLADRCAVRKCRVDWLVKLARRFVGFSGSQSIRVLIGVCLILGSSELLRILLSVAVGFVSFGFAPGCRIRVGILRAEVIRRRRDFSGERFSREAGADQERDLRRAAGRFRVQLSEFRFELGNTRGVFVRELAGSRRIQLFVPVIQSSSAHARSIGRLRFCMMELPQPRPFGTEGRKATHDFLSLCSHSTLHHQDPRPPPSSQDNFLKTHDFLGKTSAKEEATSEISSSLERPPPPAPPVPALPPQHSVEHVLPGGIGTYSISHISFFNNQNLPKPEAAIFTVAQASSTDRTDENSNCSSYTNSGFTLWDESAAKKGKTGKENVPSASVREAEVKLGPWSASERPSHSSCNNNHRNSFSSLSSSQPSGAKRKSFMDMIRSAKSGSNQEEELDDDGAEFVLKKETSPIPRGELRVKVDRKISDQKASTPRSKHSATEQRRRSKINDRFQMLRSLIPNSDQKRDKASFLLEVIEYIQYLQEKVTNYEGSFQGWSQEPAKIIPLRNGQRPTDDYVDQSGNINSGSGPALVFAAKVDENNIAMAPAIFRSANNPLEPEMGSATAFKSVEPHPGMTNRAAPFPNISRIKSLTNECSASTNKLNEEKLTIEGGTISISNVYSQGLLNTLTQALQNSGVDLSQASISVQIELGKQANGRNASSSSIPKDSEARNQGVTRPRATGENADLALKKLKTGKR